MKVLLGVNGVERGWGLVEVDDKTLWWRSELDTDDVFVNLDSVLSYYTLNSDGSLVIKCKTDEDVVLYDLRFDAPEDVCRLLDYFLDHLNLDCTVPTKPSLQDSSQDAVSSVILRTHVTSLKFIGDLLFAGVGDVLHVYSNVSGNWILLNSKKIEIFNGQNIYGIVALNGKEVVVYGGKTVALLRTVLLTSEIQIRSVYCFQVLDWILDALWLPERHVVFLTANNSLLLYNVLLVKSTLVSVSYCQLRCILYSGKLLGTHFKDLAVLAGTVFSSIIIWVNDGNSQFKLPIHQLEGHKGVIFSIVFCPKTNRICSTSDDRSVRLWDVVFDSDDQDWRRCSISLRFSLYGHSARVWRSCFVHDKIVSVGEDSRVCLWNNNGTLANQWCAHQEGEVWSLDASNFFIATGGSDGGITLWPICEAPVPQALDSPDEAQNTIPKGVGLLQSGVPYMINSAGDMFILNGDTWKSCFSDPRFSSYCQHSLSPSRTLLALGNIAGYVVICKISRSSVEKLVDVQVCKGRIFSLIWVTESSFVVCGTDGNFSTWELSLDLPTLKRDCDFILPYSKERWITACATNERYLVCGDRLGSIFLYSMTKKDSNPTFYAKRIHGHNGVTDVKFLGGKFVSSGRDGKYREFIVENDQLFLLRCCKLKLDWVAAVLDDQLLGRILVCFHETSFIIWTVQHRRPILKIDCGGGHRSWDCLINQDSKSIFISYIKGKTVHYCCVSIESILCHVLLPGGHPKAINAAALVPGNIVNLEREYSNLVFLGGEDTTLRLISINQNDEAQLNVLQSHLSSVRTVSCLYSSSHKSAFVCSGGGRGQIVVWKMFDDGNLLEVVELASLCVMQLCKDNRLAQTPQNDTAEMRIMDLQLYQTSNSIHIATGGSDGILRIFSFSTDSNSIVLMQHTDLGHCLLKVLHACAFDNSFLMTTCTDGTVVFLHVAEDGLVDHSKEPSKYLVSDSGINSCDYVLENNRLIVSCAGDSAHVFILLVVYPTFKVLDKWTDEAAHICQVSGLKMCDNFVFTSGLDQLLSIFSWTLVGNEVRANLLTQVKLSVPDIHGALVWKQNAQEYAILVYGLGHQLLHFNPSKSNGNFKSRP